MFTKNNPKWAEARKRAEELLSKMTLEEKIIQLTQYIAWDNSYNPAHKEKDGSTNAGRCGTLLAASGAEAVNGLQKIAVEYTPHNIPIISGCDVIHGYKTTFPIPLALSCTFNTSLVRECYGVAGKESKADGVDWVYAPMVDIARDARWGRVAEGYGEDTYLVSQMAAAAVHGYQDDGGVMACMKHFVGYSNCEGGRDYAGCNMSDQTLFNTFLPPFQAGIDAGVGTFMCSFNEVNGVPVSGNRRLLTDVLRGKMGFDGFVISDYDSVLELIKHGYAEDEKDAAYKGFNAGVDELMSGNLYNNYLPELIEEGKITMEQIDYSTLRILTAKYILGVMDNPFKDEKCDRHFLCDEYRAIARRAVRESVVLLENDGTLPLKPTEAKGMRIAVVGPYADENDSILGCWASLKQKARTVTIKQGLESFYPDAEIICASGVTFNDEEENDIDGCIEKIKNADIIFIALGEHCSQSGEATSKTSLEIEKSQLELFDRVCALSKKTVALISAGRPLIMDEIRKKVNALLYIWAPGTECGNGICDVISGAFNPAGKTTISFPHSAGQCPVYYNHTPTGRPALGELFFESKYLDVPIGALYPFGYGLSYSDFEYSDCNISESKITAEGSLKATLTVKNNGEYEGYHVVQLYTRDIVGSITRPVCELKKYEKIFLKAGEEKTVEFTLNASDLAFWNADMEYTVEKGKFKLWIAHDSADKANEFDFEVI